MSTQKESQNYLAYTIPVLAIILIITILYIQNVPQAEIETPAPKEVNEKSQKDANKPKEAHLDHATHGEARPSKTTNSKTQTTIDDGKKERKTLIQEKDEYYVGEYVIDREKVIQIEPQLLRPKEKFIQWNLQFSGSVCGKVLVDDSKLYFGTYDYQAFVIEKTTGKFLFRKELISQPIGNTQFHHEKFLIPQRNGQVTAFSTKDYKLKWNHRSAVFKDKKELDISITGIKVFGDLFYVSKHWGNLYIGNAKTGVMAQDVGVPYESRINLPAIKTAAGIIYSNVAGELHCFNDEGSKQWEHTIKNGYPTAMYLHKNNLIILNTNKNLISFNLKTKKNNWEQQLNGYGYDSITSHKETLYVSAKDIYSIDPSNGKINWKTQGKSVDGFCRGPVMFHGDNIFYATEQSGRLCKINNKNGSVIKQYNFKETVRNPLQLDDNSLYISTLKKRLYAINIKKFK